MKNKSPLIPSKGPKLLAFNPERIKVKLDARTIIILHDMSVLKVWRKRFPDAQIIK